MTYSTYRFGSRAFIPSKLALAILCAAAVLVGLPGCSSSNDADAVTLADGGNTMDGNNTSTAFGVNAEAFDVQGSRNSGAWGSVYMNKAELKETQRDIVDYDAIPAFADDPELKKWQVKFGSENAFDGTDGAKLYHDSCAGCHMHKGEGAIGAGYYPPLANNTKMESKYYIIDILINGFRGMPSFHAMMNDEQMAAVTQYVVTELNGYKDTVTAADVAQLRHDDPPGGDPSDH